MQPRRPPPEHRARELISALGLAPHPEGGHFRETYRSALTVRSPAAGGRRCAVTDIYYLLAAGEHSRFHRVRHDEIWHFYEGSPLELLEWQPEHGAVTRTLLGGEAPPRFKHCVPGGTWQAARPAGAYTLVGCTVAPGFDFADFALLRDDPTACAALLTAFPEVTALL